MPPRKTSAAPAPTRKRTRGDLETQSSTAQAIKKRKLNAAKTPSSVQDSRSEGSGRRSSGKPDVYEVPDSDEEAPAPDLPATTTAGKRGRRRKASISGEPTSEELSSTRKGKVGNVWDFMGSDEPSASKSSGKGRWSRSSGKHKSPEPVEVEQDDEVLEIAASESPSKGRGGRFRDALSAPASAKKLPPVSSARHGRNVLAPVDSPALKSILSPKKKGGLRTQKSVVFVDKGIELHLDPPSSKKGKKTRGRPPKPQPDPEPEDAQAGGHDGEDEACELCGKPDITRGNDILFCDRCDMAVHQKCYGISKIPRGDWFCRKCTGEEEPKLGPHEAKGAPGKGKQQSQALNRAVDDTKEDREDEDEDTPCAICGNADTEDDNDIIFCDNCEYAVHQKCYNVLEIPEGDWLCRKCAKKDVPAAVEAVEKEVGTEAAQVVSSAVPDIPNFDLHLRTLQRILLDRCTGRRILRLRGQDEAYEKVSQVLEQTVLSGEGNSMLIVGARGSGKTALIESAIWAMEQDHKDDFIVVRLNGFIHTDDKLALKEIWRQLGRELSGDEENKTTNYADTMTSLLYLLSSHEELTGEHLEEDTATRSVVFVIDEFDLFCTHARQTLLYNLFDIAQARKAPIAVFGVTTKIEVVELLEKRVKSRFSHRYAYMSLPKSLPAFWDICRQGLVIDEDEYDAEGIDKQLDGHEQFYHYWAKKIEHLRKNEDFDRHLKRHWYSTKSVSAFFKTCILPLSQVSATNPTLSFTGETAPAITLEAPDSKLHLLSSLADLDLALLIAAARLDIVAHTDTVNFAMAYDEYTNLMAKQRVASAASGLMALGGGAARVWGRNIAATAWERLISLGFLVASGIGGGGTRGLAAGGLEQKMWKVDVALEEIPHDVELNSILARWCKEI